MALRARADSITAVLDDLGSSEAVLLAGAGALATAALFAATHPSRTTALVALEALADPYPVEESRAAVVAVWGTGELQHAMNPDMPWNEEIRTTWARMERLAASPRTVALMLALTAELDVRAVLPTVRVPTHSRVGAPPTPSAQGQRHDPLIAPATSVR